MIMNDIPASAVADAAPDLESRAHSDDHFDTHPDDIHWGHVGTLEHYAELLKRITDSAFKEGEHAD